MGIVMVLAKIKLGLFKWLHPSKPWCCSGFCMGVATWEIRSEDGLPYDPYDYTHACDRHVGALLNTFDAEIFEITKINDASEEA